MKSNKVVALGVYAAMTPLIVATTVAKVVLEWVMTRKQHVSVPTGHSSVRMSRR